MKYIKMVSMVLSVFIMHYAQCMNSHSNFDEQHMSYNDFRSTLFASDTPKALVNRYDAQTIYEGNSTDHSNLYVQQERDDNASSVEMVLSLDANSDPMGKDLCDQRTATQETFDEDHEDAYTSVVHQGYTISEHNIVTSSNNALPHIVQGRTLYFTHMDGRTGKKIRRTSSRSHHKAGGARSQKKQRISRYETRRFYMSSYRKKAHQTSRASEQSSFTTSRDYQAVFDMDMKPRVLKNVHPLQSTGQLVNQVIHGEATHHDFCRGRIPYTAQSMMGSFRVDLDQARQ